MANIFDVQLLNSIVSPKTPKLGLEPLYPNFGAPIQMEETDPPEYGKNLIIGNVLPYLKELTPTTDMGAKGITPQLAQGIMQQAQPFEFLSSAYEDQDEDAEQVDYLPGQEPSGIAKLLDYIPFAGEKSLGRAIINMLPKLSPEAQNIRNFYGSQFGLTPTGQVASGIMKGYNPVSGSNLLNRFTGGLVPAKQIGLAPAIRRRIDRIANRKIAQTDTSRARIKELQDLARADTISRARFDNPNVYSRADSLGFTDSSGGFKSAGTNENFSNKTGRGRTGY